MIYVSVFTVYFDKPADLSNFDCFDFEHVFLVDYYGQSGRPIEAFDDKARRVMKREYNRCKDCIASFPFFGSNFVIYKFYFYYDFKPSYIGSFLYEECFYV